MVESTSVLVGTAVTIALMHTLAGPDHYLPFIVLGRAEKWSLKKILSWTALCGAGHVLSSILVGLVGILLGWNLNHLEWFEGVRGNIAVWALIFFGFIYMFWGIAKGLRGHDHTHEHNHDDPNMDRTQRRTFWALFTIFILGPCEPLIPMLMIPAAEHSISTILIVASVFSMVTISTMIGCVLLAYLGFELFEFKLIRRYVHAFSGLAIGASGLLLMMVEF